MFDYIGPLVLSAVGLFVSAVAAAFVVAHRRKYPQGRGESYSVWRFFMPADTSDAEIEKKVAILKMKNGSYRLGVVAPRLRRSGF